MLLSLSLASILVSRSSAEGAGVKATDWKSSLAHASLIRERTLAQAYAKAVATALAQERVLAADKAKAFAAAQSAMHSRTIKAAQVSSHSMAVAMAQANVVAQALAKVQALAVAHNQALVVTGEIQARLNQSQAALNPAPYYPPTKIVASGPAVPAVVPIAISEPSRTGAILNTLVLQYGANPTRFDAKNPVLGPMLGAQLLAQQLISTGKFNPNEVFYLETFLLPQTPYYEYFRARRSLNPTRFDTYHPGFSAVLAEDQRLRDLLLMYETLRPVPAGTVSPQDISAVPEPGPMVLGAIAAGICATLHWARRRS